MIADLHVHSKYSYDCRTPLNKILKTAFARGLDGIAITDHNTLKGYYEAKALAKKFKIELILGYELKTSDGDILIYGLEELLPPLKPAAESIALVHEKGGVVVAAHPFDPFRKGIGRLLGKVKVDGIEVANSHCLKNKKARVVAAELGIAQIGGSDAHICAEIGTSSTIWEGDLLESIKAAKTIALGGLRIKTIPIAMAYGMFTIPGRIRERIKRWRERRARK